MRLREGNCWLTSDGYNLHMKVSKKLHRVTAMSWLPLAIYMISQQPLVVLFYRQNQPLSHLVTGRRLRLCGHINQSIIYLYQTNGPYQKNIEIIKIKNKSNIARSSTQEDHHRAVAAVIRGLPPDWKRPLRRPVEADLGQQNIGLSSAWRKAAIRDDWRRIVDTATLQRSMLWKKKRRKPTGFSWFYQQIK